MIAFHFTPLGTLKTNASPSQKISSYKNIQFTGIPKGTPRKISFRSGTWIKEEFNFFLKVLKQLLKLED